MPHSKKVYSLTTMCRRTSDSVFFSLHSSKHWNKFSISTFLNRCSYNVCSTFARGSTHVQTLTPKQEFTIKTWEGVVFAERLWFSRSGYRSVVFYPPFRSWDVGSNPTLSLEGSTCDTDGLFIIPFESNKTFLHFLVKSGLRIC